MKIQPGGIPIKEFTITKNDAGQRLDRFVSKAVPMLPSSLAQKYIRTKRIKVGGKRAMRDYRLTLGDTVQMYIGDEFFADGGGGSGGVGAHRTRSGNDFLSRANSKLNIIYQDGNIMLIDKPAGLLCHSADGTYTDTVISRVQAYLYQNGEWNPRDSSTFTPALCNRIDRNTQGIVIAAKNAEALRIVCEKIKLGEVDKRYLAVVHGIPKRKSALLEGFIFKDSVKNRVYVRERNEPGAKSAAMEYTMLETAQHKGGSLSVLECRLITGRTHQIRAQLAGIGHPILGDSKYGRGDSDRRFPGLTDGGRQALCSYKVTFAFKTDAGVLSYLSGRTFELPKENFISKYVKTV